MKKLKLALACIVVSLLTVPPVFAQDPIIYPNQGQSPEQQEKDKFECYTWAREQTGFDPMQATTVPSGQPAPQGGVVRGAAGGALAGVAIGAIAGNAGKGAAIGAASGALFGGMRQHDQQRQQQQAQQQQAANYDNQRNNYNRAYGACLEGRGYTVK